MTQVLTETNGTPQALLAHHLKQLWKLPTFLREHVRRSLVKRLRKGIDHIRRYLLRAGRA